MSRIYMEKDVKRCRIWIPLWRVDELEAWFSDMAAQGWELKSLEHHRATFERSVMRNSHFFCIIYEPYKQKKELSYDEELNLDKESRKSQKEAIMEAGWQFVAENDNIVVFI